MMPQSVAPHVAHEPGFAPQSVSALASARAAWDDSRHRTQTAALASDMEDPCPTGAEEREAAHTVYAILSLLGVLAVFLLDTSVAQGRNPLTLPMLTLFISAISLYYATTADSAGLLPASPPALLDSRGFAKRAQESATKPLGVSTHGTAGGNEVDNDALERGASFLQPHRLLCPLLPLPVRACVLAHPRLRSQLLRLHHCWVGAETRAATLAQYAAPVLSSRAPADGVASGGTAGAVATAVTPLPTAAPTDPANQASPDCPFTLLSLLWAATATPLELTALSVHAAAAAEDQLPGRTGVPADPRQQQLRPSQTLPQFASALLVAHPRWCGACRALRPPLSKHCHKCGRCAGRADHHCPFMGSCITGKNHLHFLLFLVSQLTVTVFALSVLWVSLPMLISAESVGETDITATAAAAAADDTAADARAATTEYSHDPLRHFAAFLRPIYAVRALALSLWTALYNIMTRPDSVSARWLLHAAATAFVGIASAIAAPLTAFHAVLAATGSATYTVALGHRRARRRRGARATVAALGGADTGSEHVPDGGSADHHSLNNGAAVGALGAVSPADSVRDLNGAAPPPLFGDDKEAFILEDPFAELAIALEETGALPVVTAHAAAAGAAASRRRRRGRWLSLLHPLPRAALMRALALCGWAGGDQGGGGDEVGASAGVDAVAWLEWQLGDLWSSQTVARALSLAARSAKSEPDRAGVVTASALTDVNDNADTEADAADVAADTDQLLLPATGSSRAYPSAHGSGVSGRVRTCTRRVARALRRLRLRCGKRCAVVGRRCCSAGARSTWRAFAASAVIDALSTFWNDMTAFVAGFDDRVWLYVPLALLSDDMLDAADT